MHVATALLFGAALWFLPLAAYAQTTRTEALEQERAERAKQLRPYEPKRLEKLILDAEEGRLRRLIAPHNGFFVEYGYTHKPVGSGIGFGGGFRHDLFERQARVVFEVGETFRHYRMARVDFSLPRLAGERLELGVEGLYRRHTQDDYYGPGPASSRDDRTSYLFKAGEFQGRAIVAVRPWLSVGTRLGRIAPDIGSGTDARFPSIENRFDDSAAPGLNEQPALLYGEGFAEIDYRDEPGRARSGGHYLVALRKYADRELDQYSFRSVDLLLQQFVPVFDKTRVFAFQLGVGATDAGAGQRVPFYLQPTLGGSRTLRSAADFRFRDTHALWMNAEYRWEAFAALDMALFTDWGKVASTASDLDFSDLEHAYGIGFRFVAGQAVIMRIDLAAGGSDGFQTFFKFSKAF
jgi:hypothetical protein